ncbi:uncharacterized protein LOC132720117 isoform X2 [Ruditapes philippinarum]|nr:uncharacterized protein LOC132720117 isoform X2 [Ruditapes philippinarum]
MQSQRRKVFTLYCICVLAIMILVVLETVWREFGHVEEKDSDIQSIIGERSDYFEANQSSNALWTPSSSLKYRALVYTANSTFLLPNLTVLNNRNNSEKNKPLYLKDIFPHLKYPPFQPAAVSDFPTTVGQQPRIPHVIHQTFRSESLPLKYARYAKMMYEMNPTWTYYFWTDDSARKLIKDKYPELLNDWDSFNKSISKGDFLRYVVLYEFGGAYIDLDVEPLRPLDNVTRKYACVIPTEPFEHNVLIYDNQIFMNNAIMFCRPKHPFFKQMVYQIKDTLKYDDTTDGTGPGFVTRNFIRYNNIEENDENRTKTEFTSNSPYFYRGVLPEIHDDAIYVPNTHYFTDQIDVRNRKRSFKRTCSNFAEQPFITKRVCIEMRRRGMVRKDKRFSFLRHRWHHFWMNSDNYKKQFHINIKQIAPKRIIYGETDSILKRIDIKDTPMDKPKVLVSDSYKNVPLYYSDTNARPYRVSNPRSTLLKK